MNKPNSGAQPGNGSIKRAALLFAIVVLALQATCMLAGMRYSRVGTDYLRAGEARFLYIALTVLSPLTSYLRTGVLLLFCFQYGKNRARPFLAVTVASLVLSAAFEVVSAAVDDYYFKDNVVYHLTAAGLGLIIGLCAAVFLCLYADARRKKLADGKNTRFSRAPYIPCYIVAAVTMAAIDLLYRVYVLVRMALSEGGVSFATADDVRALVLDLCTPLIKSAAGFVFMCLVGAVLYKRLNREN